jgi:endonuclease-8
MPEGDTVYLAGRRLHRAFAGRILTNTEFRLPQLATVGLRGTGVREVRSRGKHLLFRFDDDTTLHTHFRMDGSWHLYRQGERWRGGPGHAIRIVLGVEGSVGVGYRLHDVAIVPTQDEDRLLGHLGPDICSDDWDEAEAVRRLANARERSVATALVDQRIIAGIGNIYRCETMFITGISPVSRIEDLDATQVNALVTTARTLMWRNRDRASQATTGDERRAHYVYGRGRSRCYTCDTPIRVVTADATEPWHAPSPGKRDRGSANEQAVFWCPTCQPGH